MCYKLKVFLGFKAIAVEIFKKSKTDPEKEANSSSEKRVWAAASVNQVMDVVIELGIFTSVCSQEPCCTPAWLRQAEPPEQNLILWNMINALIACQLSLHFSSACVRELSSQTVCALEQSVLHQMCVCDLSTRLALVRRYTTTALTALSSPIIFGFELYIFFSLANLFHRCAKTLNVTLNS